MTQSTITNHVKDAVQDAKAEAQQGVRTAAENVQQSAIDQTEQSATAAHRASDAFDAGSLQAAALDQLAQGLDGLSRSLQERSIDGLADDVAMFARRNPLLFLGGAALAGFAAARFLKSSPTQTSAVTEDPWANHLSHQSGRVQ